MARKNRLFAKLASDVDTSGNLAASGIQSEALDIGVTVYATRANLPTSGNTAGDQAYVTGNNRLYIWNGSGWYNIALLNVAPSIQSVLDSGGGTTPFSLAIDGTATTITITAADSDGDPITYSATSDSDFSGLATLSQADNVFTITPFSQDSATTSSGTITFTATDGINVASSGIQTFTLSFLSPLWDETVLSIGTSSTNSLANSTFIDRSSNANTVTAAGSPVQTAFHPYLDNWSVEFDGASYLNTGGAHIPASGDFTVEFWYMSTDLSHRNDIISQYTAATDGRLAISQINASSGVEFFNSRSGSVVTTTIPKVGEWNHFAYVRDGDTFRAFVNGVQEATGTGSGTIDTATNTYIGFTATQNYTEGFVSDVRISNTARYDANGFGVPGKLSSDVNTILLTCQSNRFIDNSSSSNTITITGTPQISAFNPFGQGSEYAVGENKGSMFLDGTDDALDISDGSNFAFGTGDFTIQGWIYSDGSDYFTLWQNGQVNLGIAGTERYFFGVDTGGGISAARHSGAGSLTAGTGTVQLNAWQHIALTRQSGTLRIYVNGVQVNSSTVWSSFSIGNYPHAIGFRTTPNWAGGYISDVRVDTSCLYPDGTTFAVPTSSVGATNSVLHISMDNAGIYDKTGNSTLIPAGNAATSTSQTKFANTAIYFDGTGDKITTSGANIGDFGTGDFTIEFWMRAESLSGYNSPIADDTYASSSTPNAWCFYLNGTSLNPWKGGSSLMSGGTLSTNTWHHCAWTRSNGTMYLFLDGTQVGTTSDSTSFNYGDIIIGSNSTNYDLQGYLENVQILKGIAKYTANFTPPTRTQGRNYQAES